MNDFVLDQTPKASLAPYPLCAMQHSNTEHPPAQHTQNQVENEEGSKDDQTDKVDPRQLKAHRIIHLKGNTEPDEDRAKTADRYFFVNEVSGQVEDQSQHRRWQKYFSIFGTTESRSEKKVLNGDVLTEALLTLPIKKNCCSPPVHVCIYLCSQNSFKKSLCWGGATSNQHSTMPWASLQQRFAD